jgi:hypothetical protein
MHNSRKETTHLPLRNDKPRRGRRRNDEPAGIGGGSRGFRSRGESERIHVFPLVFLFAPRAHSSGAFMHPRIPFRPRSPPTGAIYLGSRGNVTAKEVVE